MASTFGKLLKELIRQQGLTQAAFAQRASCSLNMVGLVVRGARRPPLDRLKAWAEVLKLSGKRQDQFVLLGNLEHTPGLVRDHIVHLEKKTARRPR